ncbi:DUF5605 domain-containing protein [Paenibacillus hexagrammi]|uniref:DUF5605 domain-containing protein n=1 Tax=Paenibacillus hexagrammi TaxID=2908839 RepID=A0ABY3SRI1_9BACL|nr:DUF5605 domain-containing protein [Paenibacillus sp. YPD9-1]UJF35611.1 DUF5605 domain-containing protein [Paenibacillus sp. YPD9-1]
MKLNFANVVERWGIFELTLDGPSSGNPYMDIQLSARFKNGLNEAEADGFYAGEGKYCIRFMPFEEGIWTFETTSNCAEMDRLSREFACTSPSVGNHGPVRVKDASHFQYADGTRYTPIGTTCYVWHLQNEELQKQTLRTLSQSPFNKIRMCVFPKSYLFNEAEPERYPYEGSPSTGFDLTRFHTGYFDHLEKCVKDLADLGLEADLILFHPYDEGRWGFDRMSPEEDERYIRYVVARLAAYRNVWWSLANEYDLMKHKQQDDWNRLFRIVQECDYGRHLRSIHNCKAWYDFGLPWITHASIQQSDVKVVSECTKQYGKPAIIDECGYEGNLDTRWGSLTPEELLCRIWEGTCRGGYVTHGETYWNPEQTLWWSHGGDLYGKSVQRIEFLKAILEDAPDDLLYTSDSYDAATLSVRGRYYLQYFGPHRFAYRDFVLPEGRYSVDIIDTWNMEITSLQQTFEGRFRIDLPGKLYFALRIQQIKE